MHKKIMVYDEALRSVPAFFSDWLTCVPVAADKLVDQAVMRAASLLLCRSVTSVTVRDLQRSAVSWVGSATSGADHLELTGLAEVGVVCRTAKGANAAAVVSYALSCVSKLFINKKINRNSRFVVIGVGEVGRRLVACLEYLGFSVRAYDPPRAQREPGFVTAPLSALFDADVICCCAPLVVSGKHPTAHLLNAQRIAQLQPHASIINVGRGGVIDEDALLSRPDLCLCFDVWANEPVISMPVLQRCFQATPHIAGYSKAAKWQCLSMVAAQARADFGLPPVRCSMPTGCQQLALESLGLDPWHALLQAYDPSLDAASLKQSAFWSASDPAAWFRAHRNQYGLRLSEISFAGW